MGVVYRARDPIINRLVALKTITAAASDNQSLLERFYREAQSAGGLQHPNIVTIFDMGDEAGVPYIAMELIEGDNLEQMISQRMPIPVSLKLLYAAQACSAFDYAHKRGIVHRDIKPGNIMVNKDGAVKVVDFGIARVLETSKTQTGMLIGTFAYMSPEQYHGEHADERSDIWSFGVLLYELLCYRRPFIETTPAALMHSICSQDAPSLRSVDPAVPADLEIVASRLLQKSPRNRYQSMEDVLLELDPICKALQAESVAGMVKESRELAARSQQAEIDRELSARKALDEGKSLLNAARYADAASTVRAGLKADPANHDLQKLLEQIEPEKKKSVTRQDVEWRIREIKFKINGEKFSEAVDLAKQSIASFGPDTDITQLLNSAHVEMEARERKRQQEKAIERIRGFVNSRDFDGATKALDAAIATKILEAFDSRAQRAADEISAGRKAAQLPLEPSSTSTLSQDFRNEYAFQQGPPSSDASPKTSTPAAEVTAKPEGASAPMKSIEPVQTSQTVSPLEPPATSDEPIAADQPVKLEMIASRPVFVSPKPPAKVATGQPLAPVERPASEEAQPKKPLLPALMGLALAAAVAAGYFLWPQTPPPKAPEVAATKTAVVLPNPLEVKQRDAMVAAEKLVAANDLEKARQTVLDAENLNGPLTPALQSMRGQIEESMRNAQLRQLRQHEAQLWQQAVGNIGTKRFAQAEAELRQVQALPDGGVHREDAQRYLTEVIPKLKQQGKQLTEARQSLKQGDIESARKFSAQLQQSGGDASELNGEIEKSEGDRLTQLESQFNQLKQGDDDSSVQQLKALQPKFQALVNSGGPKSSEAQSYVNSIQSSISDIQARAQSQRFELAFQAASRKCQQVLAGNDKSGLASARESMQSFTQNGPHADEAQKCVGDITAKLNALNQPPAAVLPPPPAKRETQSTTAADETAVLSVVQTFFRAFEERNPDELRQVWPTIPQKTYDGYKRSFADASAITMQIVNQTVNVSPDGASATVSAESQQQYTSKTGKTAKKSEASWKFQLVKKNGVWMVTDVR